MALIKCPKCGEEISDQSKQCIYCGKSLNKKLITTKKIVFIIVCICLVILIALFYKIKNRPEYYNDPNYIQFNKLYEEGKDLAEIQKYEDAIDLIWQVVACEMTDDPDASLKLGAEMTQAQFKHTLDDGMKLKKLKKYIKENDPEFYGKIDIDSDGTINYTGE